MHLIVEFDDAVCGRVGDSVRKDVAAVDLVKTAELSPQAWPVEDVVAQHKCYRTGSDVIPADDERLRKPIGGRLHGIGDRDSELVTVSQQSAEGSGVERGRDHK